jgi:hypothetical protein
MPRKPSSMFDRQLQEMHMVPPTPAQPPSMYRCICNKSSCAVTQTPLLLAAAPPAVMLFLQMLLQHCTAHTAAELLKTTSLQFLKKL